MGNLYDLWPLFCLRLRIGDLELRPGSDDDLALLAELVRTPVHDPAEMPFAMPWTDKPEDERVRGVLQWQWRTRATWEPHHWDLALVAIRDGVVVGTQDMKGDEFAQTAEVRTGSWVGRAFQGQGIGTAMRQAVLHLAFVGLGAGTARSAAFTDNPASLRVSEKVGYVPDGTEVVKRRDARGEMSRLLMTRERFQSLASSWPPVQIDGLDACRPEFG
jgi:RimJ/RimL family protein N-acetyltransferase